ncbi:hypothetical protein AQ836_22395 [Burkholderia pseudomallei]|nr:hypothetical protein AQ821_08880 [Burkholderia pseudomallei]OMX68249.1 hypothetical protein AQ830_02410 [Burkholderia pseudomallei]OMX78901.1 hypothetical protein AQ831_06005 [Burkholderia pseudomallei]OMY01788.1 hypothetical protein AQ836_22395 [Burkholderia pseudomallei]OMY57256.1 hypothetical protein AQ847_14675 [Burkholderia pseudomallei]
MRAWPGAPCLDGGKTAIERRPRVGYAVTPDGGAPIDIAFVDAATSANAVKRHIRASGMRGASAASWRACAHIVRVTT